MLKNTCSNRALSNCSGGTDGRAFARVQPAEAAAQLLQHVADQVANLAQRMVRWHTGLRRDVREQTALITESAAHRLPPLSPAWSIIPLRVGASIFQRTAKADLARMKLCSL